MKTSPLTILAVAAAMAFTSCDKAKEAAVEAETKAKAAAKAAEAAAAAAAEKAKSSTEKMKEALPGLKAKATDVLESAKNAGAGALHKGKEMADSAVDWSKAKLGIPEADGLLEGFMGLFNEAKTAVNDGMNGEKATALKAKWDEMEVKASETMKTLGPEVQAKFKPILETIKAKWDELMKKSEESSGS